MKAWPVRNHEGLARKKPRSSGQQGNKDLAIKKT
jgi:hypothetical protein